MSDPTEAWESFIDGRSVRLGDDLDAETLAERYGECPPRIIEFITLQALTNIPADRMEFRAEDFDYADDRIKRRIERNEDRPNRSDDPRGDEVAEWKEQIAGVLEAGDPESEDAE